MGRIGSGVLNVSSLVTTKNALNVIILRISTLHGGGLRFGGGGIGKMQYFPDLTKL
jgi:hypothetical protein